MQPSKPRHKKKIATQAAEQPAARSFGRDGITKIVNRDRALRARELGGEPDAKPTAEIKGDVFDSLTARIQGRR